MPPRGPSTHTLFRETNFFPCTKCSRANINVVEDTEIMYLSTQNQKKILDTLLESMIQTHRPKLQIICALKVS
jgi:hypothetical protein